MRVLALTNLYPTAWDPHRASFNRQQFAALARRNPLEVMVAVPLPQRLRRRAMLVPDPAVQVSPFIYAYLPGVLRSLHPYCWWLSLMAAHARRLRPGRYDCVLASWGYPDAVAAAWVARRLRTGYVVKLHGSDLNLLPARGWRRRQLAGALRGASAVVVVSQALAVLAAQLGVAPQRIHTVYNGVDTRNFVPGDARIARVALGLDADARWLVYVGNLKASKGCLDLVEAFALIATAHPELRLALVGEGPARRAIEQRIDGLGLAARVRLAGAQAHARIPDWMRAADLLCLPSHHEGVPNVILEAMACGRPVVATAVGGIPEVLPEAAGRLVPARDVGALASALSTALAWPWEHDAIVAAVRPYSWERSAAQLESLLRQAAGRPLAGASS